MINNNSNNKLENKIFCRDQKRSALVLARDKYMALGVATFFHGLIIAPLETVALATTYLEKLPNSPYSSIGAIGMLLAPIAMSFGAACLLENKAEKISKEISNLPFNQRYEDKAEKGYKEVEEKYDRKI